MDVRDDGVTENSLALVKRVEHRAHLYKNTKNDARLRFWVKLVSAMLIVSGFSPAAQAEELVNNLHFPGHYYDEESGLY